MKNFGIIAVAGLLLAGCSSDVNPLLSDETVTNEPAILGGALSKAINTKMGFEELLENKRIYKDLINGKKLFIQELNEKYKLYPGIEFSKDLMLGYDAKANPGLGGQVYLYCQVGGKTYIRFIKKRVDFKSVYARILDPKYKEPILMRLIGYGGGKQKWAAEVEFVDGDLEKNLPKFDGEVDRVVFETKGHAKYFVLDDFKFKEKTGGDIIIKK